MEYSIFVTNVVKHVVVPDFEPILSKKIADVFEAVQTPKSPKKPVKQKKIGGSIEPPILVRVFITKLLKILCFTAFKTYSDRALPIKNR